MTKPEVALESQESFPTLQVGARAVRNGGRVCNPAGRLAKPSSAKRRGAAFVIVFGTLSFPSATGSDKEPPEFPHVRSLAVTCNHSRHGLSVESLPDAPSAGGATCL
jgi:hypothetical protein